MKTLVKLISGLCLLGASSASAITATNTISVDFAGGFSYYEEGPTGFTVGEVGLDVDIDWSSDLDTPLLWCLSATYDYDYSVLDFLGDEVGFGSDSLILPPVEVGVASAADILGIIDIPTILAVADLADPMIPFGLDTFPSGFAPTAPGAFGLTFDGVGQTDFFGEVPEFGSVLGFFGGNVTIEAKELAPATVPDSSSTAALGLVAFGFLVVARRFRK